MIYFLNALFIIGAFVSMEIIAWALHKYVMHGFLWSIHKDHHISHNKRFENNDLFALVFGIPSWLFMMFGIMAGCDFRLYIGIGIALYGICYLLIHDGLIHSRIKVFRNTKNIWLLSLKKAHLNHHKHDNKSNSKDGNDVSYGMIWVNLKYYKKVKSDVEAELKSK